MRKLLVATMMCAGVVMQAQSANLDSSAPEMKAYLNFDFGAPQAQSLGLHYGFRMEQDNRYRALLGNSTPALMQLDFTGAHGFDSAKLNGVSLLKRSVQLNEGEDAAAPADSTGGMFSNFTVADWGLVAVGVVGVGFGIAKVAKSNESPDPKPAASGTTPQGPGGTCAPGTVPVIGGQCAPAALPTAPTGALLTPPSGGLCAPGTIPVLGGQCAPGAPSSGGLPALPSAPAGVPTTPPNPISGQCAPGTVPVLGGQCVPGLLGRNGYVIEERNVAHDNWLNADYGHMGDLVPQ